MQGRVTKTKKKKKRNKNLVKRLKKFARMTLDF